MNDAYIDIQSLIERDKRAAMSKTECNEADKRVAEIAFSLGCFDHPLVKKFLKEKTKYYDR